MSMTTVESVHQDRQLHGSSVSDGSEHHEWRTFVDHSSELSGIHTEPSLDKMQATREARTMSTSGGFEPTKPSSFAWGENNFPSERPYETSGGFDNMGDLRDTRNSLHSADGISRTRKDLLAAGSPVGGFRATNSANELRRMSLMGRGFDSARHGTPARAPSRSLLEESPGGGHGAATFSHGPRDIRFDYVFENQTNEQPKKGFEFEKGEIGFSGAKQMDSRALSFDDENTLDWGNQSTPPTPASFVSLDTTAHHTAWESGRTEIRAPAASVDSTELSGWAVAVDEESVIAETEANGLREWSRATDNFSRAGSTRSLATRDNGVACDSPWRGSVTGRSSVVPEPSLDDVQEWPRAPFDTPMSSSAWGDSSVEGWPGTTVARSLDFSNAEDMSTTNGGTHRHRRHHHHSKHHKKASPPPMANLESDDRALASSAVEAWKPPQPGAAQRSPYKRSLSAQCSQHLKKVSTSLAGQWDAFKIGVLGRRSSRVADESLRRSFDSELENYLYLMEMTEHIPSVREMVIEPWAKYFALRMQQGSEAAEEEEEVGEGEDSLGALLTEEPRPVRTERRIFVSILSFPAGLPRPDSLEMRLYTSDRSEILAMAYAARGEPLSLEVPQDIPPNPLIELIFGGCELVARYEWAAAICCPGAPLEAGLEERGRRKDEFGVGEEPKSILASFKIAYVTKESFRHMELSTEVINFGIVPTDRPSYQEVLIKNGSKEEQQFTFSKREEKGAGSVDVRIQPETAEVAPGATLRAVIELRMTDPSSTGGPFEIIYDADLGGRSTRSQLQLMGTFVKPSLEMVVEGADPETVDFGQVYFGLRKTVKVRLINEGPLSLPFSSSIEEADDIPAGVIEVSPLGGVVKAFDTTTIHVTFRPPKYIDQKGFQCTRAAQEVHTEYKCVVKVECEELQDLELVRPVIGSGIVPTLSASPASLDFGGCPMGDRRDIVVTLRNEHASLPVDWTVPNVSHITVMPASGKIEVVVTFSPKSIGHHQRNVRVMYCKSLYSLLVYAIGWGEVATVPREKRRKGLEANVDDFAPQYKFVDQENVKAQRAAAAAAAREDGRPITLTRIMKSKSTSMDHAESSMLLRSVLLERTGETTEYALSPSGMQEYIRNKQVYNDYIRKAGREGNKTKGSKKDVDIFGTDDVELGLYRKLKSPRLSVDEIVHDRLYELRPAEADDGGPRGVTGIRYSHDETKLMRKKHKAAPLTQAETRDCGRALEAWQLGLVSCGPMRLDFGTMFVRSSATRSFSVFNDLPSSILVTVSTSDIDELKRSIPSSQVIPSAKAAGFDIVLSSATPQQFQRHVNVVINGRHQRKFIVKANIVPVKLNLSESEVNFRIASDDLNQTFVERITLSNEGNAPASYAWDISDPECLSIRACDSSNVSSVHPKCNSVQEIVFTPPPNGQPIEGLLTLHVRDGPDQTVRVFAHCPPASCQFLTRKCDFGTVACGMAQERSILVGNNGNYAAAYQVLDVPDGVTVKPNRGVVPVDGRVELTASLTVHKPAHIDSYIILKIRAGKSIRIPVQAMVMLPDIRIVEEEISFGALTLGGVATTSCTFLNAGAVEGTVFVNCTPHPEFSLRMQHVLDSKGQELGVSEVDPQTMVAISSDELAAETTGQKKTDGDIKITSPCLTATHNTPLDDDEESEAKLRAYKLVLPPGYTVKTELTYNPQELGQQVFEFPIVASGGGSVPDNLRKVVSAEALRPRMILSTSVVDFKSRVVSKDSVVPASSEFSFENVDECPTRWQIDTAALARHAGVFHLEPSEGVLQPNQAAVVRMTFKPKEAMKYSVDLPVYISSPHSGTSSGASEALPVDMSQPYLNIQVLGEGSIPKLSFDRAELIVPVAALNERTVATFDILNEGYDNKEVFQTASTDCYGIVVEFPEGGQLSGSRGKVPVEVVFSSPKAVSIVTKLEFGVKSLYNDSQEQTVYSIRVCAIADNSMFTLPAGARPQSEAQPLEPEFLVRWLNSNALRVPIDRFPEDCIAQNGRHLIDAIEALSGKPVKLAGPGTPRAGKGQVTDGPRSRDLHRAEQLVKTYEQIMQYLLLCGARLAHVRPEYFLSSEHFVKYCMAKYEPGTFSRRQLERLFPMFTYHAWSSTFLQIIKLFFVSRVTVKKWRGLIATETKSIQETKGEGAQLPLELQALADTRTLQETDSLSLPENVLLRWLNYCFIKSNKGRFTARKIENFAEHVKDCLPFSLAIEAYHPVCQIAYRLSVPAATAEDIQANAQQLMQCFTTIGLEFPLTLSDFTEGEVAPRDMVLLTQFLFETLPSFSPKATVLFPTPLGVPSIKIIEITNPAKGQIRYSCAIQGSKEFVLSTDHKSIVIPGGRGKIDLPVEFKSHFSRPAEAVLTLTSQRENNLYAAPMVFKLISSCTGKSPRKSFDVSATLYEVAVLEVEVDSPFGVDSEFQISMNFHLATSASNKAPRKSKLASPIGAFHIDSTKVRVKKGNTSRVVLHFLPFEVGHFVATLAFFDPNAGEFIYEVTGASKLPQPNETQANFLTVKSGEVGSKELLIPTKNAPLEKALQWLQKRGKKPPTMPESVIYSVHLGSRYMTAPKEFTTGNKQGDGKLEIKFKPREPGIYPCTVILSSTYDYRVYKIEAKGTAPNTLASLSFETFARRPIVQDIPVVNATDQDWTIKATLRGDSGGVFGGPREFVAKRASNGQKKVTTYPLKFSPDWACQVTDHLILQNVSTNDVYEYELRGEAKKPLAEDHIVVECTAREQTSVTLTVPNYSVKDVIYEVESDLLDIFGDPTLAVPSSGKADYIVNARPLQARTVTGSVKFAEPGTGRFVWYTIELRVSPPKPEDVVKLSCVVRQAVSLSIDLANPLNTEASFFVTVVGDGLVGEDEFVLPPKESGKYELMYSPLKPTALERGSVVFLNEQLGEFWYQLELVADQPPPEELELLECDLGKSVKTSFAIENPTSKEAVLRVRNTNKVNFRMLTKRLVLPPLGLCSIEMEYMPSALESDQRAELTLTNSNAGTWEFILVGRGLQPSQVAELSAIAQVNKTVSESVSFRNPLLERLEVEVSLDNAPGSSGAFKLLGKKRSLVVRPLETVQVAYSFTPSTMSAQTTTLIVKSAKEPALSWKYRITGIAEAPTDAAPICFTVEARQALDTFYTLTLLGLDLEEGEKPSDALFCELEVPDAQKTVVRKSFQVDLAQQAIEGIAREKNQVALSVKFSPLRPFVGLGSLVVSKRDGGGRWRFDIRLEATYPPVDDVITIESPLNKATSVAFHLCNFTETYAEFEAFFEADSAFEFSVTPTSGVLEPASAPPDETGQRGTAFIVTYKPTEYGKPVMGKLIIRTDDVLWSYLVKGTHPAYTAPTTVKSKVVTHLSPEIEEEIARRRQIQGRKNFVKSNTLAMMHRG